MRTPTTTCSALPVTLSSEDTGQGCPQPVPALPPLHPPGLLLPAAQGRAWVPSSAPLLNGQAGGSWGPLGRLTASRSGEGQGVQGKLRDKGPLAVVHTAGFREAPSSLSRRPLRPQTQQGEGSRGTFRPTFPGLASVLQLGEGPGVCVPLFQGGSRTGGPCRGWVRQGQGPGCLLGTFGWGREGVEGSRHGLGGRDRSRRERGLLTGLAKP